MSIIYPNRYPGKAEPTSSDWPAGAPRAVSAPGAEDGTPWSADTVRDPIAFGQSLMKAAGVAASGVADNANGSQYQEALLRVLRGQVLQRVDTGAWEPPQVGVSYYSPLGRVGATELKRRFYTFTGTLQQQHVLEVMTTDSAMQQFHRANGTVINLLATPTGIGCIGADPDLRMALVKAGSEWALLLQINNVQLRPGTGDGYYEVAVDYLGTL